MDTTVVARLCASGLPDTVAQQIGGKLSKEGIITIAQLQDEVDNMAAHAVMHCGLSDRQVTAVLRLVGGGGMHAAASSAARAAEPSDNIKITAIQEQYPLLLRTQIHEYLDDAGGDEAVALRNIRKAIAGVIHKAGTTEPSKRVSCEPLVTRQAIEELGHMGSHSSRKPDKHDGGRGGSQGSMLGFAALWRKSAPAASLPAAPTLPLDRVGARVKVFMSRLVAVVVEHTALHPPKKRPVVDCAGFPLLEFWHLGSRKTHHTEKMQYTQLVALPQLQMVCLGFARRRYTADFKNAVLTWFWDFMSEFPKASVKQATSAFAARRGLFLFFGRISRSTLYDWLSIPESAAPAVTMGTILRNLRPRAKRIPLRVHDAIKETVIQLRITRQPCYSRIVFLIVNPMLPIIAPKEVEGGFQLKLRELRRVMHDDMGMTFRSVTGSAGHLDKNVQALVHKTLMRVCVYIVRYGIPEWAIANFDQSPFKLWCVSDQTYEYRGADAVPITGAGKGDKREMTMLNCCCLDGTILPPQLIKGGTTSRCIADMCQDDPAKFAGWHVAFSPHHWSTFETMKQWFINIGEPARVQRCIDHKADPNATYWLDLLDGYSVHISPEMREWVRTNMPMHILAYVYAGTTSLGQPLDSKGANSTIQAGATEACSAYIASLCPPTATAKERVQALASIDTSMTVLNKLTPHFAHAGWSKLRANPKPILAGWAAAGMDGLFDDEGNITPKCRSLAFQGIQEGLVRFTNEEVADAQARVAVDLAVNAGLDIEQWSASGLPFNYSIPARAAVSEEADDSYDDEPATIRCDAGVVCVVNQAANEKSLACVGVCGGAFHAACAAMAIDDRVICHRCARPQAADLFRVSDPAAEQDEEDVEDGAPAADMRQRRRRNVAQGSPGIRAPEVHTKPSWAPVDKRTATLLKDFPQYNLRGPLTREDIEGIGNCCPDSFAKAAELPDSATDVRNTVANVVEYPRTAKEITLSWKFRDDMGDNKVYLTPSEAATVARTDGLYMGLTFLECAAERYQRNILVIQGGYVFEPHQDFIRPEWPTAVIAFDAVTHHFEAVCYHGKMAGLPTAKPVSDVGGVAERAVPVISDMDNVANRAAPEGVLAADAGDVPIGNLGNARVAGDKVVEQQKEDPPAIINGKLQWGISPSVRGFSAGSPISGDIIAKAAQELRTGNSVMANFDQLLLAGMAARPVSISSQPPPTIGGRDGALISGSHDAFPSNRRGIPAGAPGADVGHLTVAQLKDELRKRKLTLSGDKTVLAVRLSQAMLNADGVQPAAPLLPPAVAVAAAVAATVERDPPDVAGHEEADSGHRGSDASAPAAGGPMPVIPDVDNAAANVEAGSADPASGVAVMDGSALAAGLIAGAGENVGVGGRRGKRRLEVAPAENDTKRTRANSTRTF